MKIEDIPKEFNKRFVRKNPEGEYQPQWFLLETVTGKDMLQFIQEVATACISEMTVGEKVFVKKEDSGLLPQEMLPEINMKHKVFVNAHNQARNLQIQQGKEIMERVNKNIWKQK